MIVLIFCTYKNIFWILIWWKSWKIKKNNFTKHRVFENHRQQTEAFYSKYKKCGASRNSLRMCVAASLNQRPSVAVPKIVSRLNSCGAELPRWQEAAGEGNIMNKEEGGVRTWERGGRGEKWRDSKMLPSLKL